MPQPISMIFGTHQCCFILTISVHSPFIKFIKQSVNTWRKLVTVVLLSMNATGSSV